MNKNRLKNQLKKRKKKHKSKKAKKAKKAKKDVSTNSLASSINDPLDVSAEM